MARGDAVDAGENVVRLIRHIDFKMGIVGSSAFDRPEKDHDGLSVSRRGVLASDEATDLRLIKEVLGAWRTLKASNQLAQISVADILAAGEEARRALLVIEDPVAAEPPKPGNPAHALILGLPFIGSDTGSLDALTAGDLLARKIEPSSVYPALEPNL
jgi:hypothetical protein